MINDVFITINHLDDYAGLGSVRPGMTLRLKKDHNNCYDDEAIAVCSQSGAKYGYVANSVGSVCRGTHSAGYVYQMFVEETDWEIWFVSGEGFAIAKVGIEKTSE